ncbi:MAG: InlB B-repeat-containing protein [Clostridia bacterium]|nr:InlB B-repeat-containing protein [Clostridia bacterium]
MRKKIIASIILIIMLWQAIGNCCFAVVNEMSLSESAQEVDTAAVDSEMESDVGSNVDAVEALDVSSDTANKSMEVGDQYITEDDLLYSNKYLVKDGIVSRIDPNTTILEFKQGVEIAKGNELKFYTKDGITEVTQGVVGTGMLVRGTNGQEYKLSIKGDMTGEGEANQVELTMMIRDVIELQGWELVDENAASGDITGDGEINLVDINKMIRHIVFGDWEYDTRTTPNPPTIEIVGKEGQEADLYTSEVKMRIVEDKSTENLKSTYKLSGAIEKEESSIAENEEITISEDGEYLITAYTYGIQGNRSKASNRKIVINTSGQEGDSGDSGDSGDIENPDDSGDSGDSGESEIYNIAYELNGGENNTENPKTYKYGTETILKAPTRVGYTFEGWYKEAEFTNKIEKIEATQKGDITVYAKWTANKYDITYELNGGTNNPDNSDQYTYGEETVLKDPTKEGNTFDGWYKEPEFINKIEKTEPTQMGDITIYAKWIANEYNITYELNGGENNAENPKTYTYGIETVLKDPTRLGHTFEGWYKEAEFTNKIEKIEATQTGDITVYAKWTANSYDISYELNGGTNNPDNLDQYTYGEETTLKDPTKDGNTFEGWYTEPEFINKIEKIDPTQIGDIIIYAKWEQHEYTIQATVQGEGTIENETEVVKHGENSTKQIKVTPSTNKEVSSITVNGEEFFNYEEDEETGVVVLPIFENVTEDKNIIITIEDIKTVVKVIDAPEGYESLIGKEYRSITKALKDITTDGVTLQLIADTKEEFILANRQITLDLNGKSVNGSTTTVTIENGNLTLIDSNSTEQGKVISATETAIYVKDTGTLNFGQNEGTVETDTMLIQGETSGVKNEGVFNFYDGTIIGIKAIEGETTEVPIKYNISIAEENSKQVATLKVMTGAEAAIGQKTFFKLEDAIAYANTSIATDGSQVEITIIDTIQKTETVNVANGKNVKIDLNGYEVSFVNGTDGILNNGKLEIVDTKDTGTMIGTVSTIITNGVGGELTITSGTIVPTHTAIENESTGTVMIKGGTITTNESDAISNSDSGNVIIEGGTIETTINYSSGIWNGEDGTITIKGGTITTTGRNAYGIKNASNGTIIVEGGTVTGTGTYSCSGILNSYDGTIKVEGGTISGRSYGINLEQGGTVIVNGGKITTTTESGGTGIYIKKEGIVTFNDGEISILGDYGTGINNYSTGTVTMTGGTISVGRYGIYNRDTGTVTMTGGTINITGSSSDSSGIDNYSTGTVTIGEKDGTVNQTSPSIIGVQYGVYNESSGKINFYDGTMKGVVNQSIYGAINEIEEGYNIIQTVEDSTEITTLGNSECFKVIETDTLYSNLQDAIDSINTDETQTIQVVSSTIVSADRAVTNSKNIVLDLNGKDIKFGKNGAIDNAGTIEIIDSSEDKTGIMTALVGGAVINQGGATLKITSGTISNVLKEANAIESAGTLQVEGGTIKTTGSSSNAIRNYGTGTVIIIGGKITGLDGGNGITSQDTGTVTVKAGTLSVSGCGICNESTGTVTMDEGTITGGYGIRNKSTGEVVVNGGNITTSSSPISNYSTGTVTIAGGTFAANSYVIYNFSSGTIIIDGGKFSLNDDGEIIENYSTGTIIINDGEFISTYDYSTGIVNLKGTVTMLGGTITVSDEHSYGINNLGTLIIGEKDGEVSTTAPSITSGGYGLYNEEEGKIYFYDGIIKGATGKSTYGSISEVEENYDIIKTVDETTSIETAILEKNPAVVNTTTNKEYYNIQSAITEAEETETLQVVRDIITPGTQETVVVEAEKDVVLDLNGYSITFGQVTALKNLGTLTIEDTSSGSTGSILSTVGNIITNEEGALLNITGGTISNTLKETETIVNNGMLNIEAGTIESEGSYAYPIKNQGIGILNVKGGTIETLASGKAIINQDNGVVTVDGGTVVGYNAGIYNSSIGTVTVEGGTVKSKSGSSENAAIYNESTGAVVINGGTISALGSYSSGIYNASTGTVTVNNGEIIGEDNDIDVIYNKSTGTVTITGGTITANDKGSVAIVNLGGILIVEGGIITSTNSYAISILDGTNTIEGGTISGYYRGISYEIYDGTGTLTIGRKDGEVSTTIPSITGNDYGIYNYSGGNINFYDGIIKGALGKALYIGVKEVEDGYYIVSTVDESTSTETVILENSPMIVNTTTNEEYDSLQTAITEAGENETLQLVKSINTLITDDTIIIETEKDVVLDLNGNEITFGQANAIKNMGTLTIEDSSESKTGGMRSLIGNVISNEEGATLNITGGTITTTLQEITTLDNKGIFLMEGGTIDATGSSSIAIKNQGIGEVTLKGGTVKTEPDENGKGIYNSSIGAVIVEGGTVIGDEYGIYNTSAGTITVSDGTVSATNDYYSNSAIYSSSNGEIVITGGTLTSNNDGIYNNSTGTVRMTGGSIITTNNGIYNNYGTLTITGGSIVSDEKIGIINDYGTATLEGVTITANEYVGVYNAYGILTIGTKDGNVSTTVPSITGGEEGLNTHSAGTTYFYDGIIKGSTIAISGNVTEVETNYEIIYSENDTVATLQLAGTNYKSVSIGDIYYDTLQAAVNDAKDGDTIQIWANIILDSTVEIPEGLNITIELNGNNLTGNGLDVLINNRGTVNVVDSVGTGSITNPDGETIKDIT